MSPSHISGPFLISLSGVGQQQRLRSRPPSPPETRVEVSDRDHRGFLLVRPVEPGRELGRRPRRPWSWRPRAESLRHRSTASPGDPTPSRSGARARGACGEEKANEPRGRVPEDQCWSAERLVFFFFFSVGHVVLFLADDVFGDFQTDSKGLESTVLGSASKITRSIRAALGHQRVAWLPGLFGESHRHRLLAGSFDQQIQCSGQVWFSSVFHSEVWRKLPSFDLWWTWETRLPCSTSSPKDQSPIPRLHPKRQPPLPLAFQGL